MWLNVGYGHISSTAKTEIKDGNEIVHTKTSLHQESPVDLHYNTGYFLPFLQLAWGRIHKAD